MNKNHTVAIAFVLLFTMIGAITVNSLYISSVAEELNSMLLSLPDTPDGSRDMVVELKNYWESQRRRASFSLTRPELDKLTELIGLLLVSSEEGNVFEYKKSMAQLSRAIDHIAHLETFSIENLM